MNNLNEIKYLLKELGIKTNNNLRKNWLGILCPYHSDENFGNCSINIQSGVINCFSCHTKGNIKYLIENKNLNFNPVVFPKKKESKQNKKSQSIATRNGIQLNPDKYLYTRLREFTIEFCMEHEIYHNFSEPYIDYFLIPIIDYNKKIFEYEYRKLLEHEKLQEFFNDKDSSFKELKIKFKNFIDKNNIEFKNGNLYKNEIQFFDEKLKYLLKRKVLYASNSKINETIWNIDNLNVNQDLYIVEGLGSIPKIYQNISKNCTAFFGSNVSKEQINYLKKFNHKLILIPDCDPAGYKMVKNLNNYFKNLFILDIKSEDTDKIYIDEIKNSSLIVPITYLAKNLNFMF